MFEDAEFDGDATGHFDGAAEGNFAVALGEVEVAYGELRSRDVDGEVDFAAAGEVFDVAVSAVLDTHIISSVLYSGGYTGKGLGKHTSGRPGTVRAPSLPTFSLMEASPLPAWTLMGWGGCATSRSMWAHEEISSPSRLFHSARTSAEGAQPRIPGWMRPGNLTWGM